MILSRKYHTSRSVHWNIGDTSIESFPLMQRISLSVLTANSSSFNLRFNFRRFFSISFSLHCSNSSMFPLKFLFDTSTSCLLALRVLSSALMPISVTFPAPADSLKSAQHHRTLIVGSILCSTAALNIDIFGLCRITDGYSAFTNLITSPGSTLVRLMCVLNFTPAIFTIWYKA